MKKICLVAHTHWDREWYKPFQFFRTKLVYVIDHLIGMLEENPDFGSFMLDGQTVVLEDYLKIRPERTGRMKTLIASGRIITGPWYIQPDEFAPDAESLVRNLLVGMKQASSFGKPMMVGYLPDSFGHSSQMPQILRGFGIDSAVLMRGVDFDAVGSSEFSWKGLNGDEVLCVYLLKGYMNAMFLSKERMVNNIRLKKIEAELGPLTCGDSVLVMNGVDHAFAQSQSAALKPSRLEDYIGELKNSLSGTKTLEGELITPRHHRVHTSIASTRINQKAENRKLSIMLERTAEPVCLTASLFGAEYPAGLLNEAWKTLLQNQTHDGICGCCTDEVHREMDQRFAAVRQILTALVNGHGRAMAGRIASGKGGGIGLAVFNTSLRAGRFYVEAEVVTDGAFDLSDEDDQEVRYQKISSETLDISKNSIWTLYLGTPQQAEKTRIIFPVEFNSVFGYRFFGLRPVEPVAAGKADFEKVTAAAAEFANDFYKLKIETDGSINLIDIQSGREFSGLNVFEDSGEGGDTYNHSPLEEDIPFTTKGGVAAVSVVETGCCRSVFRIEQELRLPVSLGKDGKSRSEEFRVLPIRTLVTVYPDSARIDFSVELENNVLSHRLRALFRFGAIVDESFAETQFGVVRRKTAVPACGEDWPEKPLPIYSMQRFAGLADESCTLAVLNRGLTEYEVFQDDQSTLAVTLHRGVSMMGKPDLAIRPGRASGIEIPVPDAESLGLLRREYSLLIGRDLSFNRITAEADSYTSPPTAIQSGLNIERIKKENKDFFKYLSIDNLQSVIGERLKGLPRSVADLISLNTDALAVSAVKKAEDDDSVIIRLYNPGQTEITGGVLTANFTHDSACIVNLGEEKQAELYGKGEYLLPEIGPFCQITIKLIRGNQK